MISQITMKRRSVLYIVNFILPILFFLCLDLASFLISENSGEKLSFKVTVLLAVTVMQLIMNEILPSSSDTIPLIDESKCTHAAIINELNLTDKVMFSYTRPAKNYSKPTEVFLDVHLYAILDIRDKEQELVTHIWVNKIWRNPLISWDSDEYCGIPLVYYPAERLWNPDIMIDEMTEKDKATQISYLAIYNTGYVFLRNGMVLVSTCKMQFYKFPFDIQSCNLTFKSISMSARDLKLSPYKFPGMDGLSQEALQYEWLPMNITVRSEVVKNYGISSSIVVYTITMKRRSVLYAVNFILPTLFFFCLDLASFLILDSGGEKLSFKVTVLLAVTVMQLILNDILPSSSDRIPLIAVYCIGVFGLMMTSLLETILVMYLMQKDKEADKQQRLNEDSMEKRGHFQNCFRDMDEE
ncbi:5-hydroxytryptamine receptor 3A-like [Labrus mixtus]|uniref:5-hydroxytryptamine receptor 3A-like n=1 Tax=Labrus mixtus TaxID=508554 RepID=UPI0029C0F4D6|nr:5-hydroxytryptamine receptor 3A-like [Labrus mixtus]